MSRRISRKQGLLVGALAALTLLAVTALPGSAAPTGTKFFTFGVSPSTPVSAGQTNQVFKVTIKNTSPKLSSSNISSVAVVVPSQFQIVGLPTIDASSTNGVNSSATVEVNATGSHDCVVGPDGQQVSVCGIAPVKSQKTIVLAITTNVTSTGLACGDNTSGAWTVKSNTGSLLNGDDFALDPAQTAAVTTTITKQCPLDWVTTPSDGAVGTGQTVTVGAYNGGNPAIIDTSFTGVITIQISSQPSANTLTVTPITPAAVSGQQSFTLTGSAAGSYTIYATATGKGNAPAKSFTLSAIDSSIAGQVWRDHNNNGLKDLDEAGQSGWLVKAFDGTAQAGTATTDANGNYTVGNLSSGKSYTICEFAPAEAPGFEYRGWIQSVPSANTLCDQMSGAEPNGLTVAIPGPGTNNMTGSDFLNVRTITIPGNTVTVVCSALPPGGVFTIGDGVNEPQAEVTIAQDACKPGVYVFESWVALDGAQVVNFYPTFPKTNTNVFVTQNLKWIVDGDRAQSTLYYDDSIQGVGERTMLYCKVKLNGSFDGMPDPVSPDTAPHTTCLMHSTEDPTPTGTQRLDVVITIVDGGITRR